MKKSDLIKIVKESVKKVTEQAYGHATLTSQGQSISGAPGVWEATGAFGMSAEDLAATYSLERLQQIRDEVMMDMEQNAEPEGGHIADQYADQIEGLDQAITIKQGRPNDKSYTEVVLSKLAGPNDAKEYDNKLHRLIIYPGLGSLQYKSRSTQEIVFTHIEGKPAFVRAFGLQKSYFELKKVLPELGQMGDSSYSGFMNVGVDDEPIPMDNETAIEMVKAMVKGKDAEAGAQSAFYTRQPGTGGTGIDEKLKNQPFPGVGEEIEEQEEPPAGQPDQAAAKGTGKAAKKGPTPPKPKKHPYDPDDLKKKQAEMLEMQRDNMKVDIYNMKQTIRFTNKTKSSLPADQQSEVGKQIAGQKKQVKEMTKQLKQFNKQISDMKKTKSKQPAKEGFIKSTAKSLLNQYEKERKGSNLNERVYSHKRAARRQVLMEGAMAKFFEYFDEGKTNEEIVQLYAQKGVSVPETFASKARSQYESMKKLKLELETSEQNFKDVSKMMVNNASEEFEGLGSEKTLASGLTK
jgi:hypothetical protein